jgi:hypothetical protein
MNSLIQLKKAIPVCLVVLIGFGLSPASRAVSPPPDGGYPGKNTAEGDNALLNLTTGMNNTAIGFNALRENRTGSHNTATGVGALRDNRDGADNTADGYNALAFNTSGASNTAVGLQALFRNTIGNENTANGGEALFSNTIGEANTANGSRALFSNTAGSANTATGFIALHNNTTGNNNTANGVEALFSNTTGFSNTAIGHEALENNRTGSRNIAVGVGAGEDLTTGDNNIDIGARGTAGESGNIRIGTQGFQNSTFIQGIFNNPMAGMVVVVAETGKLGVTTSSARFKDAIKPMGKASATILQLKPVIFRYKEQIDPDRIPQFGLVAEEVEKLNPDLVVRDKEGKPYSVRYDQVNAMLLNEFLKEHSTVQELKKDVAALTATVKEQASQIQKVSAQVEASKPAPQVVNNP